MRALTWPVDDDELVLPFAGYEFGRKGLARAIEAIAGAGDRRIRLWVAGGDEPGPYQASGATWRLGARAVPGPPGRAAPLFQAADAFVMPSGYEAFGLVLLETLACGTPLITSQVAGVADS